MSGDYSLGLKELFSTVHTLQVCVFSTGVRVWSSGLDLALSGAKLSLFRDLQIHLFWKTYTTDLE